LTQAPLFTAQALRYASAALLLLVLARCTGVRPVRPRGVEWLWLCGVAATGLVLFNVAVVRGVSRAEPAVIAVAVACAPVLIGVFGPLLEGGRPTRRLLAAATVVTAGGLLVVGTGRTDLVGAGWAVVALLCEAGFTLLAVPVLGRLGPWGVSVNAVWMAAVAFAVIGAVVEGPAAVSRLGTAQWAAIGYLAVMVTAVAFLLWYSAVAALGSGRAGLLTGVAPVAAAGSGAMLGAGLPAGPVWGGMVVVVCGLVIGLCGRRPGTRERPVSIVGNGPRPLTTGASTMDG
jgi:drug/metabolite transporter (DMT)-like permease